jgi:hypothetical protein
MSSPGLNSGPSPITSPICARRARRKSVAPDRAHSCLVSTRVFQDGSNGGPTAVQGSRLWSVSSPIVPPPRAWRSRRRTRQPYRGALSATDQPCDACDGARRRGARRPGVFPQCQEVLVCGASFRARPARQRYTQSSAHRSASQPRPAVGGRRITSESPPARLLHPGGRKQEPTLDRQDFLTITADG